MRKCGIGRRRRGFKSGTHEIWTIESGWIRNSTWTLITNAIETGNGNESTIYNNSSSINSSSIGRLLLVIRMLTAYLLELLIITTTVLLHLTITISSIITMGSRHHRILLLRQATQLPPFPPAFRDTHLAHPAILKAGTLQISIPRDRSRSGKANPINVNPHYKTFATANRRQEKRKGTQKSGRYLAWHLHLIC